MKVSFEVQGTPVGKGRPRFARQGNFVRAYTPEKTANYETLVQYYYSYCVGHKKLQGAIKAKITAYFPIPKSTSKKLKAMMLTEKYHFTKKPDGDNIAKAVLDALNDIAFDDDSQVAEVTVLKRYSEFPRTEIVLEELEEMEGES